MKQRITEERLDELTESSRKKLQEWYVVEEGDWIAWKNTNRQKKWGTEVVYSDAEYGYGIGEPGKKIKGLAFPLLSIGQMIEFLDEQNEYEHWWEELLYPEGKDIFPKYEGEICDALWEAVKEVLKKP